MADLAQLENALRAADAAGDTEAATALAGAYREAQAATSQPTGAQRLAYLLYKGASALSPAGALMRMAGGTDDPIQDTANLGAGAVRGAGSIGATLVAPYDMASDAMAGKGVSLDANRQRRADMDAALQNMGADPSSLLYQGGKMGAEVAGTAGAGGLLAKGLRAVPMIGRAGPVINAIESAGMTTRMTPTSAIGRLGDMGARVAGGAVSGGLQAGLADPEYAGTGAMIGGALPAALKVAGAAGQGIGRVVSGPGVAPEAKAAADMAQSAGYVIPPTQVRPSLVNRALEGAAGKLTTAQNASAMNQDVTNRLARQAIGANELSPEGLAGVRRTANQAYTNLGNAGEIVADDVYRNALGAAAAKPASFAQDFGELANKPTDEFLASMAGKQAFDANSGIEAIKRMREIQRAGNSPLATADQKAFAKANGQAANALEGLIERNLEKAGKTTLLDEFRAARKTLAKAYDVEKALNPTTGNVDAKVLAAQLKKGRPLTSELLTIAQMGESFPKAVQLPERMGSLPQFSPLDLFSGLGGAGLGALGGGPVGATIGAAAPLLRPAARYAALSPMVQRGLTKPPAGLGAVGLLSQAEPALLRSAPVLLSGDQ